MNLLNTFLLTCSHKEFIAAGKELLITCTAKLTNMASCAKCFRYHTITKCSRWYSTLGLSISYTMFAHLVAPLRFCQSTSTTSQTFVTSCLGKGYECIYGDEEDLDRETWKRCLLETTNSYKALTLLAPMSNMVATNTSPALWQASRTSFIVYCFFS